MNKIETIERNDPELCRRLLDPDIRKVVEIYQDADPDFQRWIFQHIMKIRNSKKATTSSNR